jgi:hypothetical protein
MGRGIVHPVDAMQTEPWNQDLLDVLANRLRRVRLRPQGRARLHRHLAGSSSPAPRSSRVTPKTRPTPTAARRAKRLTAEQFVDAVWRLTGTTPSKIEPKVPRARRPPPSKKPSSNH